MKRIKYFFTLFLLTITVLIYEVNAIAQTDKIAKFQSVGELESVATIFVPSSDRNFTESEVAATIKDLGRKGASDDMESDSMGRIYITDYERNAIRRRSPPDMAGSKETLVFDDRVL